MNPIIDQYWQVRLNNLKKNLEANHFEVFIANSAADARWIVLETIIPGTGAKTVSWGGSMTIEEIGLEDALLHDAHIAEHGQCEDFRHSRSGAEERVSKFNGPI